MADPVPAAPGGERTPPHPGESPLREAPTFADLFDHFGAVGAGQYASRPS
jgi:hypothetical protein